MTLITGSIIEMISSPLSRNGDSEIAESGLVLIQHHANKSAFSKAGRIMLKYARTEGVLKG